MPGQMTPKPKVAYTPGPSVAEGGALLAWLRAAGKKRVRLPIVVRWKDEWRHETDDIWIGVSGRRPSDAISIFINDTRLGVGLHDTLRTKCPKQGDSCAIWVEGVWGTNMPVPGQDPARTLTLLAIGDVIVDAAADARAGIES